MPVSLVKCDRCRCERYPNQLEAVSPPLQTRTYNLCPDCRVALDAFLADKIRMGFVIKASVPAREIAARYSRRKEAVQ
jgi:hypothetical protein